MNDVRLPAARTTNATALESRARALLASSIRTIGDGDDGGGSPESAAHERVYPSACAGPVDGVVDSATALIAARTFSKLGRSDLAWDFLRTLFGAQGSNGFLPRWVYLNRTDEEGNLVEGAPWTEFVGPYPGPKLFAESPDGYVPRDGGGSSVRSRGGSGVRGGARAGVWSSNTIMAPPFHATTVLEVFYMSNQTTVDVGSLAFFHDKLHKWHEFLHGQIDPNCARSSSSNSATAGGVSTIPCLAVRHPWETEIELSSPLWKYALENITRIVAEEGWKPDFEVPRDVKKSFDYPGDEVYESMLYLAQCLSDEARDRTGSEKGGKQSSADKVHSRCPFKMIDVGFTAALAKSDKDLHQIGQILLDKQKPITRSTLEAAEQRSHRSKRMLHRTWDDGRGTFLNRMVNLTLDAKSGNATYSSNGTAKSIEMPVGSNFAALWGPANSTMVEGMVSQMLQHSGEFSFSCGDYPLWSVGDCEGQPEGASPHVLFLLNHRVSQGLRSNKEAGLARFLERSSLNLLCGLPNSDESNLTNCPTNRRFASAYSATSQLPVGQDECGLTSTITAAIVLDMLIPTKPFAYESEPPYSSSSVIFLIAVELAVAFGVGVACLLLSLNLMRRANADEEGDEFVQIVHDRRAEEEELLVRSPAEDAEDVARAANDSRGSWSVELISHLNPLRLWETRHSG